MKDNKNVKIEQHLHDHLLCWAVVILQLLFPDTAILSLFFICLTAVRLKKLTSILWLFSCVQFYSKHNCSWFFLIFMNSELNDLKLIKNRHLNVQKIYRAVQKLILTQYFLHLLYRISLNISCMCNVGISYLLLEDALFKCYFLWLLFVTNKFFNSPLKNNMLSISTCTNTNSDTFIHKKIK